MQRLHSLFMGMIISTLLASGIVFDQNVLAEDLPVFVNGQSELESEQGLNGKDRLRKHQQEFLRGHCDPSGAVRPDLWQKGVEHVKQSPDRVDALKKIFNKHGAKIKDFYALLGQYDTLFIVDAPNDETVAKLSLYVAEQGNARIETHRAFTETEFRKLLSEID